MAKRKAQKRFYMVALGALIAMLAIVLVVIITAMNAEKPVVSLDEDGDAPVITSTPNPDAVFAQGVTVESIALGGKTYEEGRAEVEKALDAKIDEIGYTLKDGSVSKPISSEDMRVSDDLDAVLQAAMKYSPGQLGEDEELSLAAGQDFKINLSIDREALVEKISTFAAELNSAPVEPTVKPILTEDLDARFDIEGGKNGRELDSGAVADKLIGLFNSGEYSGDVSPEYTEIKPTMDEEYLKENTKRRGTYQTRFRYSSSDETVNNRCFNIDKAAGILNGTVVLPGEEFSFNGTVGLRTKEGGWKEANGISGGKEYTLQAGGGICQVSTTLYLALLSANMEITDRRAHSIPSDYAPKGLDATVDSSGIDLKFRNNTSAPIYIFAYWTKDKESSRRRYMHVSLYGEPLPEGVEYKPRSEVLEEILRDNPVYTEDATLPVGYQIEKIIKHDGYVAEAYLDKLQDGEVVESKLLGKDRYRGNEAEIVIGTGDPALVAPPADATLIESLTPPEEQAPPVEGEQPEPEPEPSPDSGFELGGSLFGGEQPPPDETLVPLF